MSYYFDYLMHVQVVHLEKRKRDIYMKYTALAYHSLAEIDIEPCKSFPTRNGLLSIPACQVRRRCNHTPSASKAKINRYVTAFESNDLNVSACWIIGLKTT